MKLLIVEDSRVWATMLCEHYMEDGQTVETMTEDFVRLLDRKDPSPSWSCDVILCDLDLGTDEPSGLSLLEHAREQHPHIGRVALTGSPGLIPPGDDVAHLILGKPRTLDELLDAPHLAAALVRGGRT